MAGNYLGLYDWYGKRDEDGYLDYTAEMLIRADYVTDGPGVIMNTPGTPLIGSAWNVTALDPTLTGAENNPWVFCRPNCEAKRVRSEDQDIYWMLIQQFSNRPLKRCQDTSIDNPLSEPPRLSGSYNKFTKEIFFDRNGKMVKNSCLEPLKGVNEFDDGRHVVEIELTQLILPLAVYGPMIDRVNDAAMWGGIPKRCVKLSHASWRRLLYGTCTYYYTVNYGFEINFDTWDRITWDEGTRRLPDGINPEDNAKIINDDGTLGALISPPVKYKNNPRSFEVYKDPSGAHTSILLDGKGRALKDGANPVQIKIEYYQEANFNDLFIPASL